MSPGPADDDDLPDDLPIEITPDIIEGSLESGPTDAAMTRPPGLFDAALLDPRAEADLYLAEAALADAARAAPLIYEAAHLHEQMATDSEAALATFQEALARDATFMAAWGPVRRMLSARGSWTQLVAAYDGMIRAGGSPAEGGGGGPRRSRRLADLWVERGRIHDDHLARPDEAAASYREATVAAPESAMAQLARLLGAVRTVDGEGVEAALAGLIACADTPARRAALAAELARVQRIAATTPADPSRPDPAAASRALETLQAALAGLGDRSPPPAGIIGELEAIAHLHDFPRAQAGALEELARRLPADAAARKVALHRERARLLRDVLHDLPAAHAAFDDARRLMPGHPLLTAELLDVAEQLGSFALLGATLESSAIPQDELQAAARLVDVLARAGRASEALDLVRRYSDSWAADPLSSTGLAALSSRIALYAETGDAIGLADAFEVEGERTAGLAAAHALVRAATLRDSALHDPRHAESLYRKALVQQPGYPPAVDALEAMLRDDERWTDLARLLEDDLTALPAEESAPGAPRRRYLLRVLVALHRDRLGSPARALAFQRQWVALEPSDLDAWVAKRDLELAVAQAAGSASVDDALRKEEVATLIELAARAGVPAVTAALENEAAALVTDDPSLAERFFRDAAVDDRTGIAAGNLEPRFTSVTERRKAITAELAAATAAGMGEAVRGLRHRLAAVRASAGEWKEAIAALAPLRVAGDDLARAWSFDRARQSGDASLEVAVLDGHASGAGAGLTAPADLGEALERAGNADAAQIAYREALRRGRSTDAGVGLMRTATAAGNLAGVSEALRAIGDMSFDDSGAIVAAAATREAELLDAVRADGDGAAVRAAHPAGGADAEDAILDWLAGVRAGDHRRVADALIDVAAACAGAGAGPGSSGHVALLARAAARSRLAGRDAAETIHRRAWAASPGNAAVAHGITDVRVGGLSPAAGPLPDGRAERAARLPASASGFATELDLERALEKETRGSLRAALEAYARILARDPDCLEAMLGVRRLARAGGDTWGEARALARLGALVKTPAQAGALFAEAATLYQRAGRREEAVVAYLKVLEHLPEDEAGYQRLVDLLRAHIDAPGNAKTLDRVLGQRLQRRGPTADADEVINLLSERAMNRLNRLEDRESAVEDFKRILKIDPRHEDALRQLATVAIAMQHPVAAARLLERYLQVLQTVDGTPPADAASGDASRAATVRLELARAYEDARDRPRAIDALRGAAAARPRDTLPIQRLTDLYLRAGDWSNAITSLRAWEALVTEPTAKAELQLRIGTLLRDDAYDLPQAAVAFRCAADLDRLGDGTRELALLQESAGNESGRIGVMEHAIHDMRRALDLDPLHLPSLRRLKELLDGAWRDGRGQEASRTVAQVMALLGEPMSMSTSGGDPVVIPPRALAPTLSSGFWSTLAVPGALGFLTEVWLLLVDAVLALRPTDAAAIGAVRQNRVAAPDEPRLAWIVETAAVLGLPGLALFRVPRAGAPAGEAVDAVELPAPGLAFAEAALSDAGGAAFQFGRALGLLRYRASSIIRISADDLQILFLAAGAIAGAAPGPERGVGKALDADIKALSKAMGRKERKALALQASRFGFEPIDAASWQKAILRTAERLGLVLGGDVRAAVGAVGAPTLAVGPVAIEALRANEAAVDLVRFALGQAYLALRKEAAGGI